MVKLLSSQFLNELLCVYVCMCVCVYIKLFDTNNYNRIFGIYLYNSTQIKRNINNTFTRRKMSNNLK